MEIQTGKRSAKMDEAALLELVRAHREVAIDLGTGDGRFVLALACRAPATLAIGVDSCREQLRDSSRQAPANALYLIANAERLPAALNGLAGKITVNFPWGSLLGGLLAADSAVLEGLGRIARPGAELELRLNGGALAEAGWAFEDGVAAGALALRLAGWRVSRPQALDAGALR
ncbi:MAG TPA: class I SAM-dependent methyltransferase, partial [Herpetosiphonaceae bacterium]